MEQLEEALAGAQDARFRLIVSDAVFSMDGEVARLPEIGPLADKYDSMVMIDECHGTGVLGKRGRGAIEATDMLGQIGGALTQKSFPPRSGRALAEPTGASSRAKGRSSSCCGRRGGPTCSATRCPPTWSRPTFGRWKSWSSLRSCFRSSTGTWRISGAKWRRWASRSWGTRSRPLCPVGLTPVLLRDASLARDFANEMLEQGIYVIGFSFPVVAKGLARIRVQLSACHEPRDVEHCVRAFEQIGRKKGVI